ncbi:hypothetical protein Q4488_13790 [Amphritea sp. 1_MG-2023]|nr:hypothetical protein [Amphritea sp. 1_MG-2023]MDO6564457.1 hypothetical protein [Amphritea sp. 1_MG-2023]
MILTLLCGRYTIYAWSRFISLTHPASVTGVRWLADKKAIAVCLAGDHWYEVVALEQRLSFPVLLGFKVKLRDQNRSVAAVIWSDSVSVDQYRKLRVLLRFAAPPVNANHSL